MTTAAANPAAPPTDPPAAAPTAPPTAAGKRKASGAADGAAGKRKKYSTWSFSDEQEQGLVEWLQANTFLWLRSTKDYHRKNAEWEKKAMELGVSLTHLKNWWKNIKDWFVKLVKKTSGQATRQYTDRDRWILKNVAFYKSKYMSLHFETVFRLLVFGRFLFILLFFILFIACSLSKIHKFQP